MRRNADQSERKEKMKEWFPKGPCVKRSVLVLTAVLSLAGCTRVEVDGSAVRELQEGQKKIMEQLDKFEANQTKIIASLRTLPQPAGPAIDFSKVWDIRTDKSAARGSDQARVTLVEFSDYQCPYCRANETLIQNLLDAFPNDLKVVFKNYPLSFHKRALPAAKACEAARLQDKFWEMQKRVWENPQKLEDEDLRGYARDVGLDMKRFEVDFTGDRVARNIQEDVQEARRIQVTGTPTLFLNGKRVQKRDPEEMKKEIQALLAGEKKPSS
jgi:protein-disulfide isomerase